MTTERTDAMNSPEVQALRASHDRLVAALEAAYDRLIDHHAAGKMIAGQPCPYCHHELSQMDTALALAKDVTP